MPLSARLTNDLQISDLMNADKLNNSLYNSGLPPPYIMLAECFLHIELSEDLKTMRLAQIGVFG